MRKSGNLLLLMCLYAGYLDNKWDELKKKIYITKVKRENKFNAKITNGKYYERIS